MTTNSMNESMALSKLTKVNQMLIEAKTLDDILKIRDIGKMAKAFAEAAHLGRGIQNHAAEATLRAERKAGEVLIELERGTGPGRGKKISNNGNLSEYTQALKETSTSPQDANRWQQIAQLPAKEFESYISETQAEEKELTTAGAIRLFNAQARDKMYSDKTNQPLPEGKYQVFYADPPWQYNNSGFAQSAANQYPTQSTDSICQFPISGMAMDDAVLFLWVTSPLLPDGLQVMSAWEFEYRASMIWVKDRAPGIRFWVDTRHEILLIGSRGSFTPRQTFDSVRESAVTRHSHKPEEYYGIIEAMFPNAKYIELFSRANRDGWTMWGNENVE